MPESLAWKQKGTVIRRSNADPPACRPSAETLCQPRASPTSSSSKAKDHSPLRLTHSERRNWGRGYSGRGVGINLWSPFSKVLVLLQHGELGLDTAALAHVDALG